jgi:D-3-phosphoglycerate dehydrogenase
MKRLRIVYLTESHVDATYLINAVGEKHDLVIFDPRAPLERQFRDADVVVDSGGSVGTRAMLDAAAHVRLWQIQGSGFEHFDLGYWQSRGVPIANCPSSASAPALAERAMMFTLMLAHRYPEASRNLASGIAFRPAAEELGGKILGLVGFGASAIAFAGLARTFGMRLATIDVRAISDEEATARGLEWYAGPDRLDELLAMADVLSLHLHLNEETRGIIDGYRLSLLKPTALLINVARGALVEEGALSAALLDGRLAGAGLDVFASEPPSARSPLLGLPNVVATPHTAGNSDGTLRRRAEFCAQNINRVAAGLEPDSQIA